MVAGTLLVGVFLTLLALGVTETVALHDPSAVRGIANGLIPGLFTFISIVLSINQLVLSQEFGSPDEIRDRIEEVRQYRREVEDEAGAAPSPVRPTHFLTLVVDVIGAEATALRESVDDGVDPAAAEEVAAFADAVRRDVARARQLLERAEPGRANAIIAVLEYRDSVQVHEARRLLADHGGSLPDRTAAALDDVIATLELFDVARTQFRTTYTQRVLARLSRLLLYVGIPAILAAFVLSALPRAPGAGLDGLLRLLVVCGLLAVGLAPLAVLFAYILRIATVSERTLSIGPFVPPPRVERGPDEERFVGATPGDGAPGPAGGDGEDPDRP